MASEVEDINLHENANKLSIDYNSYIMLTENYLDEIKKYNNDLLDGSTSIISMLTDAGELLSLDILTRKLNSLEKSNNKKENLNEINLICALIKEKIESAGKESKKAVKEEIKEEPVVEKVVKIDEVVEEVATPTVPSIPEDIIEITTAEDLLNAIASQKVIFNPQKAANELNLPKDLIVEFVEDFLAQSKEHLSVITKAYNSNDIKTIQTTAHMLKGAASNLRLDTIAENLFKIQKEGNIEESASLIKKFVAQIKGLEQAIASVEGTNNEN